MIAPDKSTELARCCLLYTGVESLTESPKLSSAASASSMFEQISAFLFPFPKVFVGSIASSPDGFECSGRVPNPKAYIIVPSGI